MINQYFNHFDEVTVNRDKLSVLLWEQTGPLTSLLRLLLIGCGFVITNTHLGHDGL